MRRIRTSKPNVSWLQGPGPTDLWTWTEDSGAISKQELTFFGRTIIIEDGKLMTGLCHEGAGAQYIGKTGLLAIDSNVDPATLNAAYLVLEAIPEAARIDAVGAIQKSIKAELDARGLPSPVAKPKNAGSAT